MGCTSSNTGLCSVLLLFFNKRKTKEKNGYIFNRRDILRNYWYRSSYACVLFTFRERNSQRLWYFSYQIEGLDVWSNVFLVPESAVQCFLATTGCVGNRIKVLHHLMRESPSLFSLPVRGLEARAFQSAVLVSDPWFEICCFVATHPKS